ncbi:PREDICTED: leukocyte immunoglobulin-like receptor subfamily B member 3 [Chrysochloris asiatica]|uniref:Leukocyte immunoglobulin-like receptor subfamily B member 3 n=1 Tax=Chrysochloris asiatica TaxID=185453 RepID=A0A9B0TVA4_CHRAS|nr:PREDICTED: leukocyte immunoglobulin-like receptor subfamily B member 3 [Chrysochloris asiatica]
MPGSATALVLTALLSLGLFQTQQILVQPGTLPKPSIWADPDPMVTRGSPVTIRCQGSLQGDRYHLLRDGYYFRDMTLLHSREKGGSFTIQSMDSDHAGQYQCRYHSSNDWSQLNEPLVLIMTGAYSPPSLSAQPGPVMASGGNLTFICSSDYSIRTFHLLKEGRVPMVQHMDSQYSMGRHLAPFLVDPVIPSRGGTYTCYGASSSNPHVWSQASNQVHLLVTAPHPGSPVLFGASLTLQCGSEAGFDRFALTKNEQRPGPRNLDAQHSPNFTLSPVNNTHGGQYRCYSGYSLSYKWSAPSDPLDIVVTGTLPKPSIWADPDPIVPRGNPVTIRCQASLQADIYHLLRNGQYFWGMTLLNSREKGDSYTIQSMDSDHAGQYQCRYHSSNSWSPLSEPLVLTMTGDYYPPGPSLLAQPGSVVASGGKVTLICRSDYPIRTFHLLKEGKVPVVQHMDSQYSMGKYEAHFLVDPVIPSRGGTYKCYGSYDSIPHVWSKASNPVDLLVTGVHMKPSLTAHPGSPVLSGASLTLQCGSEAGFDRFALTKNEKHPGPRNLDAQHSPNFTLSPVHNSHRGQYRCYGGYNLSYEWSTPSDPLDILVAGAYEKPSLSAHPGPSVTSGQNVTLQCLPASWFDTFLLFKEGFVAPLQHLHWPGTHGPIQATFILGPVMSAQGGSYRCYTSHSTSPYLLSQPSDPLELVVSEGGEDQQRTTVESDPLRSK